MTGLALLPDWILASVSHDRTIRLWDLHTFKPLKTVKDAHETALQGIDYSPDRDELVTFAMDNFAYVWDAVVLSTKYALVGHTAEVTQVRLCIAHAFPLVGERRKGMGGGGGVCRQDIFGGLCWG